MPNQEIAQSAAAGESFSLSLPLVTGENLPIELKPGATLFLLGRNGSGKSSLLSKWYREIEISHRIAANRDLFFSDANPK